MASQSVSQYLDDLLSRRYSVVALNADRQITAAMRAADRAEVLARASREMALVRECQAVVAKCGLGGARHG